MKNERNFVKDIISKIETQLTEWFMDFFDEQENIDETKQKNIFYVLIMRPELLFTVILFFTGKISVILDEINILSKLSEFTFLINKLIFSNETVKVSIINEPNFTFTKIDDNYVTPYVARKNKVYKCNIERIETNSNLILLKEKIKALVNCMFLFIFEKKLLSRNYKQLIL